MRTIYISKNFMRFGDKFYCDVKVHTSRERALKLATSMLAHALKCAGASENIVNAHYENLEAPEGFTDFYYAIEEDILC